MTAQRESTGVTDVNSDYLEGLNFLLNEQPDKAIEVFLRMVDVDSETVETHFLLGNLFRRRGEVNRAIRLHQNIYDRGDLPKTQRNRALKARGDDYLKAGLFDRAEEILHELSGKTEYRRPALEQLVGIYEQEKKHPQRILVNIDCAVEELGGPLEDDIRNVVSYEKVVKNVKSIVHDGHVNLVETLAEKIAEKVLRHKAIRRVRVRVEKLDIIPEASSVGIEIERVKQRK